jgi:hypothetical protein
MSAIAATRKTAIANLGAARASLEAAIATRDGAFQQVKLREESAVSKA